MKPPYLEARMWWCQDEVCDCHQPQIDRVTANPDDSRFVRREAVWRGSFKSDGDMEGLRDELLAAANEHGISVDQDGYGVLTLE